MPSSTSARGLPHGPGDPPCAKCEGTGGIVFKCPYCDGTGLEAERLRRKIVASTVPDYPRGIFMGNAIEITGVTAYSIGSPTDD